MSLDNHGQTASGTADPPETPCAAPIRDKLRWEWDDLTALTGMSIRWFQKEISAGRMPAPDLRLGRRVGWRPATITTWLDSMAQQTRTRGRRA
jgi:predicted DNA-binding transcriptional regulator AlpA